jgi:thioester reductase-like protein
MCEAASRPGGEHLSQRGHALEALMSGSERLPEDLVAIIGMGCRLPGAPDLDAFWALIRDGTDAIAEVPAERFDIGAYYSSRPGVPGKLYARWGGFLDGVDKFDPYFFGISPREAAAMDPQHRLLLEVTWEAMEDAGQVVENLSGAPVGVFVGACTDDYENLLVDRTGIDIYYAAGNARSVLSGRISFALGVQGPSVTIDTACSTSLVAVHLACQSLRTGESSVAIAGGTNLVLVPEPSMAFSQAQMLARDGRCKAFDARGDGFVRSDGIAVVILKPLSRALADGDPVHAVIRGTAVNNDGKSGGLLMTPSCAGQEAVLRAAYRQARLSPADIQYVEAHGTGTNVGDPIEAAALGAVLSEGRSENRPCIIGSVKSNIGHTEAAAGVASLIKTALALKHKMIPPSLHFQTPSPDISWKDLPLVVARELTPWPEHEGLAVAGVSSFGISGTNAHVVVQEAPEVPPATRERSATYLLPLSAHTEGALRATAQAWRSFLRADGPDAPSLDDVCYTAGVRRTHHDHRVALVGRTREELDGQLHAFLEGESRMGLSSGRRVAGRHGKVVFVFPGQGWQWVGMARDLMEAPEFRDMLEQCERALSRYVKWSLLEELSADESRSRLGELDIVQPTLFAMQVALARQWRSWGVEPSAVIGHSMGEVAAAHVAGVLSLDDAARIICGRSEIVRRRISGKGGMAVVELPATTVQDLLRPFGHRLAVAARNSPTTTIVSGDPDALDELRVIAERDGTFFQFVNVDYASHSPQIEALRGELLRALQGLAPRMASIPMFSTVLGRWVSGAELDEHYWIRNIRDPVLFAPAVEALAREGQDVFVEISAHPVVAGALSQCLRGVGSAGAAVPSLRRGDEGRLSMLGALGTLYTLGYPIDASRLYGVPGRVVPLPHYPWQRERFWLTNVGEGNGSAGRSRRGTAARLLGEHLSPAVQIGTHFWESELELRAFPYLGDHRVQGLAVLPAAAYVEMALAAANETFGPGPHQLEQVRFETALILPEAGPRVLQLVLTAQMGGATFQFLSSAAGSAQEASWTRHVTGTIRLAGGEVKPDEEHERPAAVQGRCTDTVAGPDFYKAVQERGLQYGPSFQGLELLSRRDGEAIGRVRATGEVEASGRSYAIHPALLDSCFQALAGAIPRGSADGGNEAVYLPVGIASLRLHVERPLTLWSHALVRPAEESNPETLEGDVFGLDDEGRCVLEARGLRLQRLDRGAQRADVREWLYEIVWRPTALERQASLDPLPVDQRGRWLLFADRQGVARSLRGFLEARGDRCVMISRGREFRATGPDEWEIDSGQPGDLRRLLTELLPTAAPPCRGIVNLWTVGTTETEETTLEGLRAATQRGCVSVLHLVQALAETGRGSAARLWLVTAGTQAVEPQAAAVAVSHASLWGLGKTIALEYPELRCSRVDLSLTSGAEEIRALFDELCADSREDEVALRGATRSVSRLVRRPSSPGNERQLRIPTDHPFRLELPTIGILDNFVLRQTRRRPPAPGEVEIRVQAVGLNFRDVLIALGVVPPVFQGSTDLGFECAGRIVAVGEGVMAFRVGDEVVAGGPALFGSYGTVSASMVTPKPPHLSFEEAATIPIAFLTAYYALRQLGRLQAGERVLIHAAAGGVGLAAVQIAQRVGAEIFATAGTPEKRAFLRSQGVEHVMDSRSLAFAEQIMSLTAGQGVDVVLNSLAGDFISKSLSTLGPGGRFLEIGKVDVLKNSPIGLGSLERNVAFFAIDLSQLMVSRPELCQAMLRDAMDLFKDGSFKPLPLRVFPISEVVEAFRYLAQAKHIGKVVVSVQEPAVTVLPDRQPPLSPEATYLITGGLGGLGLSVARWMVEQGARHLVLVGRSGAASPEASASLEIMRESGASVLVARADVAQEAEVADLLRQIEERMPPLRGVVHAAAVLDDGILLQQDQERFARVMAPKIYGAWTLHTLTAHMPVDFFVLFSSAASVLGSPGQGNYVAANAFLDAVAHHRRARSLPALAINWGAWAEVGLAARSDRVRHLTAQGIMPFSPAQGIQLFELALRHDTAQLTALAIDWAKLLPTYSPPLLSELAAEFGAASGEAGSTKEGLTREHLQAAPAEERHQMLEGFLAGQIARVLRCAPSKVDVHQPLNKLGVDSLMAVELKNRVEGNLGIKMPVAMLLQGPTLAAMTTQILEMLQRDRTVPSRSREDLSAEVALPADITPPGRPAVPTAIARTILVTGASGFVGRFLVAELLENTTADVHCLVRASSQEEANKRLREALEAAAGWRPEWLSRIVAMVGDLALPGLGLKPDVFQTLAEEIDAIYHVGALVNFAYPYRALKAANVSGTQEILRLACLSRSKAVHYVSTLGIFPRRGGTFGESHLPESGEHLADGYAESKWVAERLVLLARSRNVPVTIYRLGLVGPGLRVPAVQDTDLATSLLRVSLVLGTVPDIEVALSPIPVDWVAKALLTLSRRPDATGRIFHLVNPNPVPLSRVVDDLAVCGYPLRRVDPEEWLAGWQRLAESAMPRLRLLLPAVAELLADRRDISRFECRATLEALGASPECPPIDLDWLKSALSALERQGPAHAAT